MPSDAHEEHSRTTSFGVTKFRCVCGPCFWKNTARKITPGGVFSVNGVFCDKYIVVRFPCAEGVKTESLCGALLTLVLASTKRNRRPMSLLRTCTPPASRAIGVSHSLER